MAYRNMQKSISNFSLYHLEMTWKKKIREHFLLNIGNTIFRTCSEIDLCNVTIKAFIVWLFNTEYVNLLQEFCLHNIDLCS